MNKRQLNNWRKEIVEGLAAEFEFEVEKIQPWHLRIEINGKRLDYFPKTGKGIWVGTNTSFTIKDIDVFIERWVESE